MKNEAIDSEAAAGSSDKPKTKPHYGTGNTDIRDAIVTQHLVKYLGTWRGFWPTNLDPQWSGKVVYPQELMESLDVKRGHSIQESLKALLAKGIATLSFRVNPRKANYPFEYRQAISLSLPQTLAANMTPQKFIDDLIHKVNAEPEGNLFIVDGCSIFGSNIDCLVSIISKRGGQDIVEYETKFLAKYPFITQVRTWAIAYNHRWDYTPPEPTEEAKPPEKTEYP